MAIETVPGSNDQLVIEARFPAMSASQLFACWTQPGLLRKWWPQEAELAPEVGGSYHLSWPSMNWDLQGEFTAFDPAKELAFTWHWDHEPNRPVRTVNIVFRSEDGNGSSIRLTHGTYNESAEDQAERQGYLDGWAHFLGQLQNLNME